MARERQRNRVEQRYIASELEGFLTLAGSSVKASTRDDTGNPDWTRDELILALNVYLQHQSKLPNKGSDEIEKLSQLLNRLGNSLFPASERSSTFRNVNGVYMKLMNFRRHDPDYLKKGKTGLSRGSNAEADVWAESVLILPAVLQWLRQLFQAWMILKFQVRLETTTPN